MKHTPLLLRIIGGLVLVSLIALMCMLPMLSFGDCAALYALGQRGKPYVFGSIGPDSYDCSGLSKDAYALLGCEIMHSSQFVGHDDQYLSVDNPSDLLPGDLIFFDTVADKDSCDHVGIWLGMNRFVHASSSEMLVTVSRLDEEWMKKYSWGKHILPEKMPLF